MEHDAPKPDLKTRALAELRSVFLATAHFLVGFQVERAFHALHEPGLVFES